MASESSSLSEERMLVARCAAGEPGAWDALLDRYAGRIARKVSYIHRQRLGRPAHPAEIQEVVQEVFLRLLRDDARALRKFKWRSPFGTYLAVVTASACYDRFRREEVRSRGRIVSDPEPLLARSPAAAQAPEALTLLGESLAELRAVMAGLPERDRLILTMYYWEGLPPARIARGMGITTGYFWVLLNRVLDRIRKRVRPDEEAEPHASKE